MTSRAPAGRIAAGLWRRFDVRRMFLGDVALKVAALAVAILLFVWASAVYNAPPPDVTLQLDGRIPVERPGVPAGFVLRGQLGDATVKLRGPEDAVRAVGPQQLRATVDLSGIGPGPDPQAVPVRVTVADDRVRVVEIAPPTVALKLERRTERALAVQARFANDPPRGFQAAPATFRPQQVTVSGPESAVAMVAAALATVRFGDAPVDLAQDVRPLPVDAQGQAVEGVEIDPVAVHVTVPVQSNASTRTVPILWQLRGDVATGFWISRVTTDPVTVTVSGVREVITTIDRIETDPIDVTGLVAGRTVFVGLRIPEGVTLIGEPQATVGITVVALIGSRPFPLVAIQAVNLAVGLAADVQPATAEVFLSGTLPALSSVTAGDVSAAADVAGRGPGTYTLEVTVRVPSGTSVRSVQPLRATVTIRSTRPSPTPAPSLAP